MKLPLMEFNKVIMYIIYLIAIILLLSTVTVFNSNSQEKNSQLIENSINTALLQCYALEGAYPSDIYYLEEYGILFKDEKYYYYYDYIDGGIMPIVTVIQK